MQIGKRISWPLTCSCTVVDALMSPLHVPVWASARTLLYHRSKIELPGYFVMIMARMGLHCGNITWCFMTHVTLTQSVDDDGRTFVLLSMKLYYLTYLVDNKLHQNSSTLQMATDACNSLHSHLPKHFYHLHPDSNSFTVNLKEHKKNYLR
jgi:hypothetical protein